MSLAALIAQGGPRISAPDIAGGIMEGAQSGRQAGLQRIQAQGLGLSNLADQIKLQQAQQAQADAELQRNLMNQATTMGPNGPQLDRQSYLAGLATGGAAPLAYSEQSRLAAQDAAAQAAKIEAAQKEITRRTQLLQGVKSPMQLAAVIPELEKQGVDVSEIRQIPFRRDWREALDGMIQQGLSHKDRMDEIKMQLDQQASTLDWQKADVAREQAQRDEAYRQAQLAETTRAHRAGEAVDWYNARKAPASAGTKPPPGYRFTPEGDLEAIPGGPADTKKIAAEEKAKTAAQKTTDFADMGIGVIDQLLSAPGLGRITGWSSKLPIFPGTDQAKADALAKQLEGQAFLQAFQSLKGGGAITNVEGEKATAAIARLQRNQSEGDYKGALQELRGILATAKSRASGDSVKVVRSKAEYDALPTGATYKTESGEVLTKGGK